MEMDRVHKGVGRSLDVYNLSDTRLGIKNIDTCRVHGIL